MIDGAAAATRGLAADSTRSTEALNLETQAARKASEALQALTRIRALEVQLSTYTGQADHLFLANADGLISNDELTPSLQRITSVVVCANAELETLTSAYEENSAAAQALADKAVKVREGLGSVAGSAGGPAREFDKVAKATEDARVEAQKIITGVVDEYLEDQAAAARSSGADRAFFAEEYRTVRRAQAIARFAETRRPRIDTLLTTEAGAQALGDDLLALYDGTARRASLRTRHRGAAATMGSKLRVTHAREGVAGQLGLVIGIAIDTRRHDVTLDLLLEPGD